jgi:hypothetical protein
MKEVVKHHSHPSSREENTFSLYIDNVHPEILNESSPSRMNPDSGGDRDR